MFFHTPLYSRCIDLDPDNLTSWMALAVSYTNESFGSHACHALKSWLARNPQYSNLIKEPLSTQPPELTFMSRYVLFLFPFFFYIYTLPNSQKYFILF